MALQSSRLQGNGNTAAPAATHRLPLRLNNVVRHYMLAYASPAAHTAHEYQVAPTSSIGQPCPLEAACSTSKAVIGLNPEGYRGLLAATDIASGEVVLQIPLHNMLQVPRQLTQPDMQLAAMTAFTSWQQQHWTLPDQLLSFFLDAEVVWESKLVAWLLYLKAAAPEGSVWHSYIQSLPAAADAITFCSYSEQQAEQLQFSTWKSLAGKQQQLLQTVQQQCQAAAGLQDCLSYTAYSDGSPNDSSSSSSSCQPDYAWALSMVKSRTFGQKLAAAKVGTSALGEPSTAAAAAKAAQELEQDDSGVFLLMAPYIDMINHAQDNNCVFGIDNDGQSFSVRCSSSGGISQGQELTISYGSNKSNLALLSCYGFQVPGNANDEQLLSPMFKSCLAAAGGLQGFSKQLLQQAAESAANQQQQQQQQQQAACTGPGQALLVPRTRAARRRCALTSLPTDSYAPQQQQQQQEQKFLAQLMSYQVSLVFKRAGTSIEQDLQQLADLAIATAADAATAADESESSSPAGSSSSSSAGLAGAIEQQAILARLEQKLLLKECEGILQEVLKLLESNNAAACTS